MIVSFLARTAVGRAVTFVVEVVRDAYDMKAKLDRRYTNHDA